LCDKKVYMVFSATFYFNRNVQFLDLNV